MSQLQELAAGVYAWLDDASGAVHTNAGLIVDEDGLTVVDALVAPAAAAELVAAAEAFELPIRRLVLTTSHLPYVGGSGMFALPAVYGTPQVSAHLDQPPNLEALRHLYPDAAAQIAAIDEKATRRVTHTVGEAAWISAAAVAAPLAGELDENLIVQVPAANIVFGGALCPFGTTPMVGTGDPVKWIEALDTIKGWGETIVPGNGPIGGHAEIEALQGYLSACISASGDPSAIVAGPWDAWSGRDYDLMNVQRAASLAAGDPSPPPALLAALGLG